MAQKTFNDPSSNPHTLTIPSSQTITITANGAGGASTISGGGDGDGGNGGYASGDYDASAGEEITVWVGGGGSGSSGGVGYYNGGDGSSGGVQGNGMGGGGSTRVEASGAYSQLISADGGGGGASAGSSYYGNGGGGGARGGSGGSGPEGNGESGEGSGYGGDGGNVPDGQGGNGGQETHYLSNVSTNSGGGNGGNGSVTIEYDNTLPAPSGVTASVDGTDITVDWDSQTNDGYIVYRDTSSFNQDYNANTSEHVSSPPYTDTSVEAGETYYYRVRAEYNGGSDSDLSSEVTAQIPLPAPTNLSSTKTTTTLSSTDSGIFQSPTSTGTKTISVGFEPDLVRFTAADSNTSVGSEQSTVDGYGWMHGVVHFDGGPTQRAIFSGAGSNSTNGQATEVTDQYCINLLELDSDGDGVGGEVKATATANETGFTLDFSSVADGSYIQYEAISLGSSQSADVGFINANGGTQTISTGFNPSFATFVGQPRINSTSNRIQDGNGWGISHGWINGSTQCAISHASYSNNVDDHVWASRNDSCLLVIEQNSKGGRTGLTEATGSFTNDGIELNYSSTTGTNETILYIAYDTTDQWPLDTFTSPSSATTQSFNNSYGTVNVVSNATVGSLSETQHSGGNQDSITYGWSHGVATSTSDQQVLSIGASSNSINDHRYYASDSDILRLLYTDQNGNDDGSTDASISSYSDSSIEINFSNTVGGGGVASAQETPPIVVYGVAGLQSGTTDAVELSWSTTDTVSDGSYNVYRSEDKGSSWSMIGSTSYNQTSFVDPSVEIVAGNTYDYYIEREVNGATSTTDTIRVQPIQPPSNVGIVSTSTNGEIELGWDSVSSANGYYVYRAESSGSSLSDYTQVADVTSPPYTDTGLEDGERYYYRVSAYN